MKTILKTLALLAFSIGAHAAGGGTIQLTGTVSAQCDVTTSLNGVLIVSANGQNLTPQDNGYATFNTNTAGMVITPAAATLTKDGVLFTGATVTPNLSVVGPSGPIAPTAGNYQLDAQGDYTMTSSATVVSNSGTLPLGVYVVSIPFTCAAGA